MKINWILLLTTLMVISSFKTNDSRVIKGNVKDAYSNQGLEGVSVKIKETSVSAVTDSFGNYQLTVSHNANTMVFSKIGYQQFETVIGKRDVVDVKLALEILGIETEEIAMDFKPIQSINPSISRKQRGRSEKRISGYHSFARPEKPLNENEDYAYVKESGFLIPEKSPYSTFSIDVDAASYSNVRRFLNNGQLPPVNAVRIEEMINYFNYDYEEPRNNQNPFAIHTEVGSAPWNTQHHLVHIGLQGKRIEKEKLPPSNLVFLIDVSGSMNHYNKLPLLKSAFKLLVNELRPEDRVSIVVYAGAAGVVLEPTDGNQKKKILTALDDLKSGGSTAGGAGIELAYRKAKEYFVKGGNNRVILATDGDFNVGASSNLAMEELIEQKRNDGIYLTLLGFGMGNYKDSKMEILADKGNGNYAYIDNILEAKKVLVNEFGGTLFTIAKDVKIQVEFNPANVQAYRLIGYENRSLNDEDFNDDQKDAGELGSGHSVTALYEVIPVGVNSHFASIDPLKYQSKEIEQTKQYSKELLTVKLRYKNPENSDAENENKSKLLSRTIMMNQIATSDLSDNFKWSASVAAYGMQLKKSQYMGSLKSEDLIKLAKSSKGNDENGYRSEFIRLMESGLLMVKNQ